MGGPLTLSIGRFRSAAGCDWVFVYDGNTSRELACVGYDDRAGWLVIVGRRHVDWVDRSELVAWLRRQPADVIALVAPHLPESITKEAATRA